MPSAQAPPPTKEVWVPVTQATDMNVLGDHPGGKIDASAEVARMELRVPHDFHSVVSIQVIAIVLATLGRCYANYDTDYAAPGEVYNNHSESQVAGYLDAGGINFIGAFSISGLVDAGPLAAGDQLGVTVTYNSTSPATNMVVLGLRLRYT